MASLQILKSGLSPFSVSQSKSGEKQRFFCSERRFLRLQTKRTNCSTVLINTRFKVYCKVEENDNTQSKGEEPPESLFMKELRRRGMNPTSLLEESNRSTYIDEEIRYKEEDGGFSNRNAISTDIDKSLLNQRERSLALNSEGLEGLIPRAKLLLTIGATFFLGFWPLILITFASFSGLYLYFGSSFVHDASNRTPTLPKYIDPYTLLEDERISQAAPTLN